MPTRIAKKIDCEDCGEKSSYRRHCHHCGLLVCGWCWNHIHACEPHHAKKDCLDLKTKASLRENLEKVRLQQAHNADVNLSLLRQVEVMEKALKDISNGGSWELSISALDKVFQIRQQTK
jgi:hypothetical protein